MSSLAVYHPSHLFSTAVAVSHPAYTTASQKLLYVISLVVSSRRYLLYSFLCSSFLVIACQSISPLCIDAFGLYLVEVRFKVICTARWSLLILSGATKQFCTRLCSVVEVTITSSMCNLACPFWVGRLLVNVPCPGPLAFLGKRCSLLGDGVRDTRQGDSLLWSFFFGSRVV